MTVETGQWWLVDDFGDGDPVIGPFDTYRAAAEHDPTDERFEPRHFPGGR